MITIKRGPAFEETRSLEELLELSQYLFVPSADWERKSDRLHVELEMLLLEGAECPKQR